MEMEPFSCTLQKYTLNDAYVPAKQHRWTIITHIYRQTTDNDISSIEQSYNYN